MTGKVLKHVVMDEFHEEMVMNKLNAKFGIAEKMRGRIGILCEQGDINTLKMVYGQEGGECIFRYNTLTEEEKAAHRRTAIVGYFVRVALYGY